MYVVGSLHHIFYSEFSLTNVQIISRKKKYEIFLCESKHGELHFMKSDFDLYDKM